MFGNNYAWNSPYGTNPYGNTGVAMPVQQANSIMCVMVQTKEEVDRYLVAANTTVLLMCFPLKKFYLKGTDANGIQVPMREFDFEEKNPPAQVVQGNSELDAINEKLKKLEEMVAAMGVKQNVSNE